MTKKKILIVSNGFYPALSARSLRATELVMEFVRQGHEVVVYTKYREYDYTIFLKEHPITLKMWSKQRFPEVPLLKGKIGYFVSRIFRRLLLLLFEYPAIEEMFKVRRLMIEENDYDLLISIAVPYPLHWGIALARTKNHPISTTWVADCGDPYMGARTDSFRKLFYFKYIEKWFSRKTDFITIPIEEGRGAYYQEFQHKIRVIPQGFDFTDFEIIQEPPKNKIPTFAFAGALTPYINSAPDFLSNLAKLEVDFKLIIYTETLGWASEYIELMGAKCEIRSLIPRKDLIRELSKMDFLINFMYKTDVQKSSKLINYALSRRPILCIYPQTSFEKQLSDFLNGIYSSQYIVKDIENYNIIKVAIQFLKLIGNRA